MKQVKVFERDEIPTDVFRMLNLHVWHPVYMYEVGTFRPAAASAKGISKRQFLDVDDFFMGHGAKDGETIYIEEILY